MGKKLIDLKWAAHKNLGIDLCDKSKGRNSIMRNIQGSTVSNRSSLCLGNGSKKKTEESVTHFHLGLPPKKLEYKIPLYSLALIEISEQLTWDLVL